MKKNKIKLSDLKVQSFITEVQSAEHKMGASDQVTCAIGCTDVTGFYNCASYVGQCATVYMPSIKEYCTIHFHCTDTVGPVQVNTTPINP